MKKILVVLFAGALLAGCMTVSSIYDGAKPSRIVENSDGSSTFEFLFPPNDYDGNMAGQRIGEYFANYIKEKGFTGYEIVSVNSQTVDKASGSSSFGAFLQNWGNGAQGKEANASPNKTYIRVLAQVKFKT
ncbi:MAG: hypothetical protein ABSG85_13710 [Spirochaetia bacterium]|jgi:hypothetical protein